MLLTDHDPQLTALDVSDLDPKQTHKAVHQALSRIDQETDIDITACAGRHDLIANIS